VFRFEGVNRVEHEPLLEFRGLESKSVFQYFQGSSVPSKGPPYWSSEGLFPQALKKKHPGNAIAPKTVSRSGVEPLTSFGLDRRSTPREQQSNRNGDHNFSYNCTLLFFHRIRERPLWTTSAGWSHMSLL